MKTFESVTMLYFMRHTTTEMNQYKVWSGRTDCDITPEGVALAKKNFSYTSHDFDHFYCSTLKRTKQTLDAIIPYQTPIIDERIIERDFGDWEGLPYSIIDDKTIELYIQGKVQPPNGETYQEVKERLISFVEDMFKQYQNQRILVVTHATIVRMARDLFLAEMKKKPIKNSELICVTNKDFYNYMNGRNEK